MSKFGVWITGGSHTQGHLQVYLISEFQPVSVKTLRSFCLKGTKSSKWLFQTQYHKSNILGSSLTRWPPHLMPQAPLCFPPPNTSSYPTFSALGPCRSLAFWAPGCGPQFQEHIHAVWLLGILKLCAMPLSCDGNFFSVVRLNTSLKKIPLAATASVFFVVRCNDYNLARTYKSIFL